jgi:hypothetical protein
MSVIQRHARSLQLENASHDIRAQLGPRPLCALIPSTQHSVIALASWFIGVITLVSTRVMYPPHLDARANDPRVSLRALGSPLLTCKPSVFTHTGIVNAGENESNEEALKRLAHKFSL